MPPTLLDWALLVVPWATIPLVIRWSVRRSRREALATTNGGAS